MSTTSDSFYNSCPVAAVSPSAALSTDQTPAVIALSAALVIVTVLLAVAIVIIALQYIRESYLYQKAFVKLIQIEVG